MIGDYLDQCACGSLFYLPEALSFLDFVSARPDLPAHVGAVAAFERAYLLCQEARSHQPPAPPQDVARVRGAGSKGGVPRLRQQPGAAVIGFAAPPIPLMAHILDQRPLPPEQHKRWWVLVAPGLDQLWSPITAAERALFTRFLSPQEMPAPALRRERRLARRLLAAGALEAVG